MRTPSQPFNRLIAILAISTAFWPGLTGLTARAANDLSVLGVFTGSSPCGDAVPPLLAIPSNEESPLRWQLALYQNSKTQTPATYELQCEYEAPASRPNGKKKVTTVHREGTWAITKGSKSNPNAVVYELTGGLAFQKIDHGLLHLLNPDRTLTVGNGGWSYTLNRTDSSETPGDPALIIDMPSYSISPLAAGPSVFGVFEGRSPCRGIARELKRGNTGGSIKAKWRVTLYQHPDAHAPTTYRVEGTLFRESALEGKWSIIQGTTTDPQATVYRLEPATTEPVLFLLKGDDNVLFFLNQDRKPMVGHADFSYTLNRRNTSTAVARQ